MDPMMAAIAAGANILGGFAGAGASRGDRESSYELAALPLQEWQNLTVPEREKLVAHLARYTSAGALDPRMEQAVTLGPSELQSIYSDPRLKGQQMTNLEQLQAIADAGGYDPTVKADLAAALRKQEQSIKANQEALALQAQARGMQSAGATQALQAMAAQSEANRTADLQTQLAAQAYRNRLSALQGASSEAGRLSAADLQEQAMRAEAADKIARFNTEATMSRNTRNVDRGNIAQQANIQQAQDILNKNTGVSNAEEQARIQSYLDDYNMRRGKVAGTSAAAAGAAQAKRDRADFTSRQITDVVEGVTKGGAAYAAGQSGAGSSGNMDMAPTTDIGRLYRG